MSKPKLNKNKYPKPQSEVLEVVSTTEKDVVVEQNHQSEVVIVGTASSKCLRTGKEYTVKKWQADYLIKGKHAVLK